MSIEEITNYCRIMGCTVSFGDSEIGFVHIDGNGVREKTHNYRRFLAHNELSELTAPAAALQAATIFRIQYDDQIEELSRDKFQEALDLFNNAIHG